MFHGLAGELARAAEPRSEADPVAIVVTTLAVAGAVAGRTRVLDLGTLHGANEFIVLVGETGVGRKGTSFNLVRSLFDAAAPGWDAILVPGLGSGEGLIQRLKTNEELDERALILETEMGRLLRVMAREGSTLSPILRDAWDGAPLGRFLSRGGTLVTRHHVACVAHITPVELRERLTDVDAANGFGNRFLWIAVRRTQRIPFPESARAVISPFVDRLQSALGAARDQHEMSFTPIAREAWADFYGSLTAEPGLTGALLARAEAHVARLALAYAVLDAADDIDLPHLAAARAMWDYAEASVRHIFGVSTGSRDADDLLLILEFEGPLSKSELRRESNIRNGARLQRAIDLLAEQRRVNMWFGQPDGGTGRPPLMVQAV